MKIDRIDSAILILLFFFFIFLEEKELIEPKQYHDPVNPVSYSPSSSFLRSPTIIGTASISSSASPSASFSPSPSPEA